MQDYFYNLCDCLFKELQQNENLLISFTGEDSDFVRFNHNKIRQAGHVTLRIINLELIMDKRHANIELDITGDLTQDINLLKNSLHVLREQCQFLPEDPYLHYSKNINNLSSCHDKNIIETSKMIMHIHTVATQMDMVGILANGSQFNGFCNSFGQKNWHSNTSFNFDWSCYFEKDKAIKSTYAGFNWKQNALKEKMEHVENQLSQISTPPITIKPGHYRAYLSPSALNEIISMMAWGGFSLKSQKTKETPLIQMLEQDRTLSSQITIKENNTRILSPIFTDSGFIKPDFIKLIENGQYKNSLISPRSAIEYNEVVNTASEYPNALELSHGNLLTKDILNELGTGIFINNLWYLNFSDRNACKLTGMTRFACFWVENGKIIAPINVMRFDESIYDLLGNSLLDLTTEREFILDPGTYGRRSNCSIELPGALISNMHFTL